MRCGSYCTASSYDIPKLFLHFKGKKAQLYRDVVHVQKKEENRIKGDVFFFSYGVVVFWGLSEKEEAKVLDTLKSFENQSHACQESDVFTYSYGSNVKIYEDQITLQNKSALTKLAISHGLAQSVKLTLFEEKIEKTLGRSRNLPTELARKGKISLKRKEISKKMGQLFIERNSITLNTEILETPEFFWDHPELEPFYRQTAHYLEITKRVEALNRKLNVVHELFEILSTELNHQHSARLEWIIIILIGIEVALVLLFDVFKIF